MMGNTDKLQDEMTLDGTWLFRIDMQEQPQAADWHAGDFRPHNWLEVSVPGNWDCYLPELDGYAGHGWYWRTFRLDPGWHDMRVHLRFEGSNYETTVWLNGEQVGVHRGGFDPFVFDVTDALDWEEDNILAVRVDNCGRVDRVPQHIIGWWNYGGIYRSVKLLALPSVRVGDVFVRAEPVQNGESAPLQAEAVLVNESERDAQVALSAQVIAADTGSTARLDRPLDGPIVDIPAGASVTVPLASGIIDARLWSPDEPQLYYIDFVLERDQKVIDTQRVRFGVRCFQVQGTQLLLNGEPILLKGFNRHEEYPGSGRVDPRGQLKADLELIQGLGGNTVRMHYQLEPALYDLADEMGLMVFAEIPLAFIGLSGIGKDQLGSPIVRDQAEGMLRTLIRELRNHPSVVIWSVGNECATTDDAGRTLVAHLVDVARSLDDTRPITYVSNNGLRERCFDLVDIQCVNVYFGLRSDELGAFLDDVHAMAPDKPLLITEFGMQSVRGLHDDGWCGEERHARVLGDNWTVFRSRSGYIPGALIWCLADYRVFTNDPDGHLLNKWRFCHGVLSLDRQPKEIVLGAVRQIFEKGSPVHGSVGQRLAPGE